MTAPGARLEKGTAPFEATPAKAAPPDSPELFPTLTELQLANADAADQRRHELEMQKLANAEAASQRDHLLAVQKAADAEAAGRRTHQLEQQKLADADAADQRDQQLKRQKLANADAVSQRDQIFRMDTNAKLAALADRLVIPAALAAIALAVLAGLGLQHAGQPLAPWGAGISAGLGTLLMPRAGRAVKKGLAAARTMWPFRRHPSSTETGPEKQ